MNWIPTLNRDKAPLYLALADAMQRDIDCGALKPGDRLPPHRELAFQLKLGVGTITKAYEEAERRNLIEAHVGRGSYVTDRSRRSANLQDSEIDLSINVPPAAPANAELSATFRTFGKRGFDADAFIYAPPIGTETARKAGVLWMQLAGRVAEADWRATACTIGAQQALAVAFGIAFEKSDLILCEAATYWGARAAAEHLGGRLYGVALDREGLCPAALEKAIAETRARALFCTPTIQNPTARTMSMARRSEIAEIAKRHDLLVIEDDVYGHFAADLALEPLVNFIPERTIYITSLSKSVMPGLRSGFMQVPDRQMLDKAILAMRATTFSAAGIANRIATEWISDGRAITIAEKVRAEMALRLAVALEELNGVAEIPSPASTLHLWLQFNHLQIDDIMRQSHELGIRVADPSLQRASEDAPCGIRLSLGAPCSSDELQKGLSKLKQAIIRPSRDNNRVVV
ncbi:PLP-dependent aminotransferase family protein [uncultured Sphingorhabdus sp.]|uniref:aminotransferase-like domain-containing protein n=1 Tax=uncultured Sphingorhabdus sp. TaxID=1686106 RepID=UPI0026173498|nr:PLP-dependent aminotransferase family protein [uncultured Sphingorhabdus sp.]HMS21282.1 PLP-dependent aminotransferase family protein [Sphingorhabdus sp.]